MLALCAYKWRKLMHVCVCVCHTDDGSTAIEIALKMAFRKYLSDRETREKRFGNGFSGNGTHSNGSSLGHSSDKPPELKVRSV